MKKVILSAVVLLASTTTFAQVTDLIGPTGNYTILKDSQGRTIVGMGVRPTASQNLGITMGTPFYSAPDFAWYWYTGSDWTSTNASPTFTGTVTLAATVPSTSATYALGSSTALFTSAYLTKSVEGATSQSLTDAAAATPSVTVAVPTNGHVAGELGWTAKSVSGSDQLVANGRVRWWGTDTAGTPVCGINKIGTDGEGHSGGSNTLVCTWTNVQSTTNCAISVTCTNDLASTQAITLYRRVDMQIPATLTFN